MYKVTLRNRRGATPRATGKCPRRRAPSTDQTPTGWGVPGLPPQPVAGSFADVVTTSLPNPSAPANTGRRARRNPRPMVRSPGFSRGWVIALVASLSVLLPAPTQAQSPTTMNGDQRVNATSLLPGDLVSVEIWREEGLSGQFQVDENGDVILPLLGRKRVVGVSPETLREDLTEDYGEYLVNPSVNVTLLRRVTVMGEVRVPGLYPVDATVSVAQLIAMAQGVTGDGDVNRIELVRDGSTIRTDLAGTMAITEAGIRSGDRILVGKRSWISRNLSSLAWITSIATNLVVLATR